MNGPAVPVALWLVPAEPARARWRARIDALAAAHGTPAFEPHVTLHVGTATRPQAIGDALDAVARAFAPFELAAGPTAHSPATFRTLYVELDDPRLHALQRALRDGLPAPGDYALAPHLSLLYRGGLETTVRTALAAAHDRHGEPIPFGELVVVRAGAGRTLYDIDALDTSLRRPLGGPRD